MLCEQPQRFVEHWHFQLEQIRPNFSNLNFFLFVPNIVAGNGLHLHGSKGSGAGMLVLSRKRDERIVINDNIVITVVDIRGDKVRLGIEAPTEMPVHRSEVYDAIRKHRAEDQSQSPPTAS
jgi:carbon storage regulator